MKYRGKTKVGNFWVFGESESIDIEEIGCDEIIPNTLCEKTSYKDFYKNEIYEYDIMRLETFNVNHKNRFFVRKINNEFFLCSMIENEKIGLYDALKKSNYMIIGNTFDGIYDFEKEY